MKKFLLIFMALIISLTSVFFVSCGEPDNGDGGVGGPEAELPGDGDEDNSPEQPPVNTNPLVTINNGGNQTQLYTWGSDSEYDLKTALIPIWQTQNVYFETVTFIGKNDTAKLLYTPTRILSVYDYSLEIEYEKDVDYTITGNTLSLTKNTRINHWSLLEYYSNGDGLKWLEHINGVDQIYLDEYLPCEHQLCVTYEHEGKWTGPVPNGQSDRFAKTISKLKNGETLNIGIIGDSITEGCGSSEYNGVLPGGYSYANLINLYLKAKFQAATINFKNKAKGGEGSIWGTSKDADKGMGRFIADDYVPDLFIIAWGMNDIKTTPETFKQNLESIIVTAKEINPDCELLLVSTMIPNSEAVIQNSTQSYMGNIPEQEGVLIDLYNGEMSQDTKTELGDTKIAVAPMTTFSQYLYSAGKRFADIGSNNVNHPNDFLHRLQAQVVLKTLLGDDFTVL